MAHALFCEKHADMPSAFEETFEKKRFLEDLARQQVFVGHKPQMMSAALLREPNIQYFVHKCKIPDASGVSPKILPSFTMTPCRIEGGYSECLKCEHITLDFLVPENEMIYPYHHKDVEVEIVPMLNMVTNQWLEKVKALNKQFG